jgi:Ca2+-transporting ATPase
MTRRSLSVDRLCGLFSEHTGLSTERAAAQRRRYGRNDIVEVAESPWWKLARDTVRDPMIWFLAGTGALYALLGNHAEALTLFAAVVPLVGMDAILHRRTQASTEGLRSHLAARAVVLRDGKEIDMPAGELVPGDLALVDAGRPFPADGIVVGGGGLQVDESILTGESYPVRKQPLLQAPEDTGTAIEARHWGLAGTRLLTGRASLRVAATGGETLYGEIVRSARSRVHERTPLQSSIANLVSVLVAAAAVVCVILAVVRLRQGHGWVDALVSALTLAVAALPEEFPVVFTFFLGVGVYRLARRQALVRRAVSVENIGRVSCICSDKTGTITEGRLRLTHLVAAEGVSESRLLALASLASRHDSNDPLDRAILEEAAARTAIPPPHEPIEHFPFTEDMRRETAIVRLSAEGEGRVCVATKGAGEVILRMARLEPETRRRWLERIARLAEDGHKVIACAWQAFESESWDRGEPQHGYRFAGLLGFEDPVREGVADAIGLCREADIRTIMITGDHPLTAAAVAREIGLGAGAPRILVAEEIEADLGEDARLDVGDVDVIARAVPSQKLGLVRTLQRRGEIVAVTGDGVNDVPALQAADIGIAMGERGTRSAREVASIVLLDDNFRTIVRAIAEGRQLFRNLQLSFAYLLMIHIPLVVTAALIPLAGYPVLYLPIHIVWLEMIIHPTALLVFQELPAGERLAPVRRTSGTRFFSNADWSRIVLVGAAVTVVIAAGYSRSLGAGRDVEHARAMALAVLTIASAVLTAALSRLRTWTARVVAAATLTLSLVLIQVPDAARLLHLRPLHVDDWASAATGALLVSLPVFFRTRRETPSVSIRPSRRR